MEITRLKATMYIVAMLFVLACPDARASNAADFRIIGGKRVTGSDWSSAVALTAPDSKGVHQILGSGVIVAPRLIVTAAHCVDGRTDVDNIRVYLGGGLDGGAIKGQYAAIRVRQHPLYRLEEFRNDDGSIQGEADDLYDFAFIELDRDVPSALVASTLPLLPQQNEEVLLASTDFHLVGYGLRSWNDLTKIGYKNALSVKASYLSPEGTELHFETGHDRTANKGDSGGPAFVQMPDGDWRVAGICSRGTRESVTYGLLSSVSHWLQWESGYDLGIAPDELTVDIEWSNELLLEARSLSRQGAGRRARELVGQVIEVSEENPEAHALHAELLMEVGQIDESKAAAERAFQLDPFSYGGLLARAALKANDLDRALEATLVARSLDPGGHELIELHRAVLESMGDKEALTALDLETAAQFAGLNPTGEFDVSIDMEAVGKAIFQGERDAVIGYLRRGLDPNQKFKPEWLRRTTKTGSAYTTEPPAEGWHFPTYTALEWSMVCGRLEIADVLLQNGALWLPLRFSWRQNPEYGEYWLSEMLPPSLGLVLVHCDPWWGKFCARHGIPGLNAKSFTNTIEFSLARGAHPGDAAFVTKGPEPYSGFSPQLTDEQLQKGLGVLSSAGADLASMPAIAYPPAIVDQTTGEPIDWSSQESREGAWRTASVLEAELLCVPLFSDQYWYRTVWWSVFSFDETRNRDMFTGGISRMLESKYVEYVDPIRGWDRWRTCYAFRPKAIRFLIQEGARTSRFKFDADLWAGSRGLLVPGHSYYVDEHWGALSKSDLKEMAKVMKLLRR